MPSLQLFFLALGLAEATKHRINVGKGGLKFSPNSTTAAVGDTVEFKFHPEQHSVVKGVFDKPCQAATTDGFFSGSITATKAATSIFTVNITDTNPVYLYDATSNNCQQGMVAVINAPATGNTLDAYKAAAMSFTGTSGAPAQMLGGQLRAGALRNNNNKNNGTATGSQSSRTHTKTRSPTKTASVSGGGVSASATATKSGVLASQTAIAEAAYLPGAAGGVVALFAGVAAAVAIL